MLLSVVWWRTLLWTGIHQMNTNGWSEPKSTWEMNSRSGGINNWNVLCGFAIDPVLYGELQSSSLASNQGNGTGSLPLNNIQLQNLHINNTKSLSRWSQISPSNLENTWAQQGNQSTEYKVPFGSGNKISSLSRVGAHTMVIALGRKVVSILEHNVGILLIWI